MNRPIKTACKTELLPVRDDGYEPETSDDHQQVVDLRANRNLYFSANT